MRTVEIIHPLNIFRGEKHPTVTRVTLYDSVKELPAWRYHELNKLFMQDAQIGSDMKSVARHFSDLQRLIKMNKQHEALVELQNLHNNMFYAIEGINLKSFCFMAMVHSIHKEVIFDFSQEAMVKNTKMLAKAGLKQSQASDIVEDIKKNFYQSLDYSFLINMEMDHSLTSIQKLKERRLLSVIGS